MLRLAEAFYLAHIMLAFDALGIIASLEKPLTVRQLVRRHRIDAQILEAALTLVGQRTPYLTLRAGTYRLARDYDANVRAAFHQYLGAYRPNVAALAAIMRSPAKAETFVDRRAHARAFERTRTLSATLLADIIAQLDLNDVLDLGCGTGEMLKDLAQRSPAFRGWGIDFNPWMCAAARRTIGDANLSKRIQILRGDCRNPSAAIPKRIARRVQTISAASLANEFCDDDGATMVAWLADLKAAFPDRTLLISDYYGQLNRRGQQTPDIALHDFVQLISGQGVPPSDLRSWKKIYRAADCRLVHVFEDRRSAFFAHVVKL
jgi:SAM-dependent methyltransferase